MRPRSKESSHSREIKTRARRTSLSPWSVRTRFKVQRSFAHRFIHSTVHRRVRSVHEYSATAHRVSSRCATGTQVHVYRRLSQGPAATYGHFSIAHHSVLPSEIREGWYCLRYHPRELRALLRLYLPKALGSRARGLDSQGPAKSLRRSCRRSRTCEWRRRRRHLRRCRLRRGSRRRFGETEKLKYPWRSLLSSQQD